MTIATVFKSFLIKEYSLIKIELKTNLSNSYSITLAELYVNNEQQRSPEKVAKFFYIRIELSFAKSERKTKTNQR